jgi:hypothetical protein
MGRRCANPGGFRVQATFATTNRFDLVLPFVLVGFPLSTFGINVSGSFLLGVLVAVAGEKVLPTSESMRLALGVISRSVHHLLHFRIRNARAIRGWLLADRHHQRRGEPVPGAAGGPRRNRLREGVARVRPGFLLFQPCDPVEREGDGGGTHFFFHEDQKALTVGRGIVAIAEAAEHVRLKQ